MNWDTVQENWDQFKREVKHRWGRLTDDDIAVIEGNHDQLVRKLRNKYGILEDEAEMEINDFLNDSPESRSFEV
jgi:uncharacterized protein YjbJ (UPF0337 family)